MTEERSAYGNENNTSSVRDDGDFRKYFTIIPNMIARSDISPYAKTLYLYLKSVTGEKGACWQGTRTLAKSAGMSVGSVTKAKQELVEHGFIEIEPGSRVKTDTIVMVDLWKQNIEQCCSPHENRCSPDEQGVRVVNVRRTLEEEPMKKNTSSQNNSSASESQDFPSSPDSETNPDVDQDVDFDMGGKKRRTYPNNPFIHSTDSPPPEPLKPKSSSSPKPEVVIDPNYDPDKIWDATPGASEGRPVVQGALTDTNEWARQYKLLDKARDSVRRVSFLVFQQTGFEPSGTVQAWAKQCNILWAAAKESEDLLIAGLEEGEVARRTSGLTFSGPRSYVSFVENAKSKRNQPKPVTLRRLKGKGNRPNNHQQVAVNSDGTVRVKL